MRPRLRRLLSWAASAVGRAPLPAGAGEPPVEGRPLPGLTAVPFTGSLREALIAKTLRVPRVDGTAGDGDAAARQVDVALVSVGFKCSRALLEHFSGLHPSVVRDAGREVLGAVRELVGDHVRHNVYFRDFPANVPDTIEFWTECIADALTDPRSAANIAAQLDAGTVNLLDLPRYGRYQHTYEEMLVAHEQFVPAVKDRMTVLDLGGRLAEESHDLYLSLAASPLPLSPTDLGLLGALAELHVDDDQPEDVPVRENRAVVNRARLAAGDRPLLVDTPVDVLRLACALSDGDVSLSTPTRLRSLRRAERRRLLAALDEVVASSPAKLSDVNRYAERFKRLGERLHPHEYPQWPAAADVFVVARGGRTVRSLAGRVEVALAAGETGQAIDVLANAPGMLARSIDRLVRAGADVDALADALRRAAPDVATRVLLSLREHLANRDAAAVARVFVNRQGRAWVAEDERAPLPAATIADLSAVLDEEIARRLPRVAQLVVEPEARTLAIPLSNKARPDGLGVLPRGSDVPVADHVRLFVYWKERAYTTDYDLSVLLLDDDFRLSEHVSWTNLRGLGAVHSGDITEAPAGASEFIDLDLGRVGARYVVPQVNVYSGEGFDRVEETFFGVMQRDPDQHGKPFEPRTVRAKSAMFGGGRVALPLLLRRQPDGGWSARWMHLNLAGRPHFNQVEANSRNTSLLVRAVAQRRYLQIPYLEDLLRSNGTAVHRDLAEVDEELPVAYLGLERPQELPEGSAVFTPATLFELLNSA